MTTTEDNVYGSGLSSEDWIALRDAIWPFLHAEDPSEIDIPGVPRHLQSHPLLAKLELYRETKAKRYLDEAGQMLIPMEEPFGWYLPLTK